eukprot:g2103.t1
MNIFLFGSCAMALASLASASVTYPPNDPNLYYSPYAWQVTESAASTINSASYLRFMFRSITPSSSLSFNFDTTKMVSPASEVYWKVDNGPAQHSLVLPTVSVSIPANNTHGDVPYHTVELFVKSTTESKQRWAATGQTTRVILTGITTDAQLAPWIPSDVNILVYGDSITEGVLTLGGSQRYDTDHDDASVVYSYHLGRLLGAETGVIGFGATGLSHGGSGGVPALGVTWNQLWDGVPRSFTDPKPDLVILNEGTNDGCDVTSAGCVGTDITALLAAVLTNLTKACPGVPVAVLEPFNAGQVKHLQAAVKAVGSADVSYVATDGFYNLTLGGSLHPTGMNDMAEIAPRIANKLRPLLARSYLRRMAEEARVGKAQV